MPSSLRSRAPSSHPHRALSRPFYSETKPSATETLSFSATKTLTLSLSSLRRPSSQALAVSLCRQPRTQASFSLFHVESIGESGEVGAVSCTSGSSLGAAYWSQHTA